MNGTRPNPRLGITAPLQASWQRMMEMLFPFRFRVWISLGLIAFLSMLGRGGCSFNFNLPQQDGAPQEMDDLLDQLMQQIETNLPVVILIAAGVLVLGAALYAAILYLGSRGTFMYVDAVYTRRAAVGDSWRRAGEHAMPWFLGHLLVDAVAFGLFLLVGLIVLVILWPAIQADKMDTTSLVVLFAGIGVFIILAIVVGVIRWILSALIAPIMYVRGCSWGEAWTELSYLSSGRVGTFMLLLGMHVVLGIGVVILIYPVACLTCCLGLLPVIHHAVFQPVYLLIRGLVPCFLAQFGGPYQMEGFHYDDSGKPVSDTRADKIVLCPHCGREQAIPEGQPGSYECSGCGQPFDVE